MKILTIFLLLAPAFAQAPATTSAGQPAPDQQTTAANPAPAPSGEPSFTGSIDFGFRFRTDIAGSVPTYRSIVNLSQGPRLFGIDFTITDPKKRLFDRLNARGYNWGDPYNTAHVDAGKSRIYDFRFDYSNVIYFNALPSFANPFAPAGFNQQSFDLHRRMTNAILTLLPTNHIVPYLAFDRNSGSGTGVSTFALGALNSFPVPTNFRDHTNDYRGGLRFEFSRFHMTLEEGGTTFKDDESVFNTSTTFGNNLTPFLGQTIQLNTLLEAYGIRAHSAYSKVLVTANPASWVSFFGQFLYSQPKTDVNYQNAATGNFALFNPLLFYTSQLESATGAASRPHTSGNLGLDLRPFRRFRIVESWTTDRFHDAASATLLSAFFTPPTAPLNITTMDPGREVVNYNRNQTDLFLDVAKGLTLRGGYRYEWGDATIQSSVLSQIGPFESGRLNRQTAIGGVNFRAFQRLSANAEYEGSSTTHAYFATSLYNFNRVRARARYQVASEIAVQVNFVLLDNQNPIPGIQYDFRSRDNAISVNWTPKGGKVIALVAEYDRPTLRSSINYLNLPFLTPAVSTYRDDAHIGTAAFDIKFPRVGAKLTAGGSFVVTNGTRTSRFYEPLARLTVPVGKHVYWNSEWKWYGFNEQLFLYEGFRTHLVQTGLRLSR